MPPCGLRVTTGSAEVGHYSAGIGRASSCGLSVASHLGGRASLAPRSFHVEFVVDKEALGVVLSHCQYGCCVGHTAIWRPSYTDTASPQRDDNIIHRMKVRFCHILRRRDSSAAKTLKLLIIQGMHCMHCTPRVHILTSFASCRFCYGNDTVLRYQ
jgi:hypothetical protein